MGKKRRHRKVIHFPLRPRLVRRWFREGVTLERFWSFPAHTRRSLLSLWKDMGLTCVHGLPGPWCYRCDFPSNRQVLDMSYARDRAALNRALAQARTDLAAAEERRIVTGWRAEREG